MSTGGWVFSIFGTLIILGLILAAISWVIRDRDTHAAPSESAREILDRRLASSELTREQYTQLRATLADERATTPDPSPAGATG